ncbi:chromate resistance protein ChrB domain-containing protein [Nonomuraea sp. NPDC049684]|uniref:chromate resistance protein ChrB domain-containing protein n=1 Tax=unclassified Nonomuraea TaxID=2593643 RepID=UPI0037B37358
MTRTWPQTDRIAWPWLIRRFIDPDVSAADVVVVDIAWIAQRSQSSRQLGQGEE